MSTASEALDDVISLCERQRVTGVLRVHGAEDEEAEIRFRSGICEDVRYGGCEGDEALDRISRIENPRFQAISSLPPISRASHDEFPREGELAQSIRPVELLTYCKERALTCTLHLRCAEREVHLTYDEGELMAIEPQTDMTISVLEATGGQYSFSLPEVELPNLSAPRMPDPESLGVATASTSERAVPGMRVPEARRASSRSERTTLPPDAGPEATASAQPGPASAPRAARAEAAQTLRHWLSPRQLVLAVGAALVVALLGAIASFVAQGPDATPARHAAD